MPTCGPRFPEEPFELYTSKGLSIESSQEPFGISSSRWPDCCWLQRDLRMKRHLKATGTVRLG